MCISIMVKKTKKTMTLNLNTWQILTKKKADMNLSSIDEVIQYLLKNQSANSSTR